MAFSLPGGGGPTPSGGVGGYSPPGGGYGSPWGYGGGGYTPQQDFGFGGGGWGGWSPWGGGGYGGGLSEGFGGGYGGGWSPWGGGGYGGGWQQQINPLINPPQQQGPTGTGGNTNVNFWPSQPGNWGQQQMGQPQPTASGWSPGGLNTILNNGPQQAPPSDSTSWMYAQMGMAPPGVPPQSPSQFSNWNQPWQLMNVGMEPQQYVGSTPSAPQPTPSAPQPTPSGAPPLSQGAPPWAQSLSSGLPLGQIVGNLPPGMMPNMAQWQSFSPTEQQAVFQTLQSQGLSPQDVLQQLQYATPQWSQMGPAIYRSY